MSKVITHSLFTEFDINLFKAGKHYQLYEKLGAHLIEVDGVKGVYFAVWAPTAQSVSVVGDFNNWTQTCSGQMKKDGNYFWTEITNLTPGTPYRFQYIVDDTILITDPYSELVLDPNNDQYINASTYPNMPAYPTGKTTGGFVGVMTPGEAAYNWTSNSYVRPDKRDLMVYELLVRDFVRIRPCKTALGAVTRQPRNSQYDKFIKRRFNVEFIAC